MSRQVSAEVAVVGTGPFGTMVARELARAGRQVTLIERGGLKRHREQLADGKQWVDGLKGAEPNHENAPDAPDYPWSYVYGVGGASLHWAGVSPRLLPSDFELRTNHGVGRDWPFGYRDLEPYYEEAERLMVVSGGGDNPLYGRRTPYPHPPHPYAPVDELVREHLAPYFPLAQSRPTEAVSGRPPCCGSASCALCPVNARWSALHTFEDEKLLDRPGVELLERTVAARLKVRAGRVQAIECIREDRSKVEVTARTVVLAANGLENPAILLRSGLDGPDVGRWLFDHEHKLIYFRVNRPTRHGYGNSLATGISYAYADGDFRAERGSMIAYPYNPGRVVTDDVRELLVEGKRGKDLQAALRERFQRTLVIDTLGEDLPVRHRRVELSPRKDAFGLPLNRIHYAPDSAYIERSRAHLRQDLLRRLEPLGARFETTFPVAQGAHHLGTCFMGERGGVVDPDLRHKEIRNLYIGGGSAFPSYSAHHPTLTIAALGLRLGRHLIRQTPVS